METITEDAEITDIEDSDDDENDMEITMGCVPFQEKVENWLTGAPASNCDAYYKTVKTVKKETVYVKDYVDETGSSHSVDTEQYIKSNRKKTTTKTTTTSIKQYYSFLHVSRNTSDNYDQGPLLRVEDKVRKEDKIVCNAASSRITPEKLFDPSEEGELNTNRKTRNKSYHPNVNDSEGIQLKNPDFLCQPFGKHRLVEDHKKNKFTAAKSNASQSKKKLKPAKIVRKRKRLTERRSDVRLKSSKDSSDSLSDLSSARTKSSNKKNCSNSKLKTLQSGVRPISATRSDSEQEDILLTAYKPFSQNP